MSISAEITADTASVAVAGAIDRLRPGRLAAAVGPACARVVQRHLRGLGKNKRGWPTTNFWARAAKATSWAPHPEGAVISINQVGVRQRYYGGHISPVHARALTIPISPVAYGHVASEFPGAFVLKTAKGSFLVQRDEDASGKEAQAHYRKRADWMGGHVNSRLRARLNFLFKLVGGVDQEPDPTVLPSWSELSDAARVAILRAGRA